MSKVYIVSRTVNEYEDIFEDDDFAFSSREKAVAKAKELFAKDKEEHIEWLKSSLKCQKEELTRNEKEFKGKGYDKYLKSAEFKERYEKFKAVHDGSIFVDTSDGKYKDTLTKEDWDVINLAKSIDRANDRIKRTESRIEKTKTDEFDDKQKCYIFSYQGTATACRIQELELI